MNLREAGKADELGMSGINMCYDGFLRRRGEKGKVLLLLVSLDKMYRESTHSKGDSTASAGAKEGKQERGSDKAAVWI